MHLAEKILLLQPLKCGGDYPFARLETRQSGSPPGRIFLSEDGNIEVWVKSWAEILTGCKARLQFVQQHLQANVDKETSLRYLKSTYEKYLVGVADDNIEVEVEDGTPDP